MLGTIGMALLGMVLLQATEAPDISGLWTSDEWGTVVLEAKQPGQYQGTMTDSLLEPGPDPLRQGKTGTIELKWSRSERRFNGTFHLTWNQPANLSGKLSIRLVDNEIRGAWTTDKDAQKQFGSPRLADLLWKRSSNAAKDAYLEFSVDTELRYRFHVNPELASPWTGAGQQFRAKADSESRASEWKPVSRADVSKLLSDGQTIVIHVKENASYEWVEEIIRSASQRLDVTVKVVRKDSEVTVISSPAAAIGRESLHGRILRVEAERGIAWIDLGAADSVKPGMKFEVRTNATDDARDRVPVVKGSVEVIRIIGSHNSEVRILKEDSEDTVTADDVVTGPGNVIEVFDSSQPAVRRSLNIGTVSELNPGRNQIEVSLIEPGSTKVGDVLEISRPNESQPGSFTRFGRIRVVDVQQARDVVVAVLTHSTRQRAENRWEWMAPALGDQIARPLADDPSAADASPPADETAALHPPIEFRIAASKADLSAEPTAWLPIMIIESRKPIPADESGANLPCEAKIDHQWLGLLWNNVEHTLLSDGTWRVVKCEVAQSAQSTDLVPSFEIRITLDAVGGALLRRLTSTHLNQPLAIVVDGTIVAAPVLRSEFGEDFVISGNFSKATAEKLAAAIRKPDLRKRATLAFRFADARSALAALKDEAASRKARRSGFHVADDDRTP